MNTETNAHGTQSTTHDAHVGPTTDMGSYGTHDPRVYAPVGPENHSDGPDAGNTSHGVNAVRGYAHVGPSNSGEGNGSDGSRARAHVGLRRGPNGSEKVGSGVLNGNTDTRGLVGADERERLASGFGSKLRELRKASGLSQERLGKLAGIGITHLSRLEQGRRRPSVDAIKALARVVCGPAGPDGVEQKLARLAGDSLREGAARRKRHRQNKHRREAVALESKMTAQARKLLEAKQRNGLPVSDSLLALATSDIAERLGAPVEDPGIHGVVARDAPRKHRIDRPRSRSLRDIKAWVHANAVPEDSDDEDDE
jgi:transcriptional regulator with XRE-family HTH domain